MQLDWFAEADQVEVTARDQQRFEIQKDRAIEVLRQAKNAERFGKQFDLLLSILGSWLQDRTDRLISAHLTLHDGAFAFLVIMRQFQYNPELEDQLSDLDIQVANDPQLDLIRVNMSLMPPVSEEALSSFLDPDFFLTYHGFGERSPEPAE